MRIYDNEADRTLGSIDLFLTHDDIDQLIVTLTTLQDDSVGSYHHAVEREPVLRDYIREINVALYEEGSAPEGWSERAVAVVLDDE